MIQNPLLSSQHIRNVFIPEIDLYASCLTDKVIPAFDNLEEESKSIAHKEFKNRDASFGSNTDLSNLAEEAEDKAIDYYVMMKNMLQGVINMFAAGLYHIFEQQIFFFHRKELLRRDEEDNTNLLKFEDVVVRMANNGIDIKKFKSWKKIYELRLVADTVKHADGRSSEELKKLRPNLFWRPDFVDGFDLQKLTPTSVYKPIMGEDFYITQQEFMLYVKAVKDFWYEMIGALKGKAKNDGT
jgi:hypothetical protein